MRLAECVGKKILHEINAVNIDQIVRFCGFPKSINHHAVVGNAAMYNFGQESSLLMQSANFPQRYSAPHGSDFSIGARHAVTSIGLTVTTTSG